MHVIYAVYTYIRLWLSSGGDFFSMHFSRNKGYMSCLVRSESMETFISW